MIKLRSKLTVSQDTNVVISGSVLNYASKLKYGGGKLDSDTDSIIISEQGKQFKVYKDGVIDYQQGVVVLPYAFEKGVTVPLLDACMVSNMCSLASKCVVDPRTGNIISQEGATITIRKRVYTDVLGSILDRVEHTWYLGQAYNSVKNDAEIANFIANGTFLPAAQYSTASPAAIVKKSSTGGLYLVSPNNLMHGSHDCGMAPDSKDNLQFVIGQDVWVGYFTVYVRL